MKVERIVRALQRCLFAMSQGRPGDPSDGRWDASVSYATRVLDEEAIELRPSPVAWPEGTSLCRWWWMRCRPRPRGKWRVVLVEIVEQDGAEFVKPWGDRNCYSRSIAADWQATFLPADGPPEEEDWTR